MKKDTFLRGAFIATVCIILTKILGVIYVIPFYAIVGADGSILYGAAYNIYAIFLSLSTVGIPLAISKLVSEYHTLGYEHTKRRTYKLAGRLMIISSLTATAILLLAAPILAKYIINFYDYSPLAGPIGAQLSAEFNILKGQYLIHEITFVIRISAIAIFFVTLISMIRGYLQGMKYIQASAVSQVIEQFLRVIVIIVGSYICMNVFHTTLGVAVGIAVFGATVGAIASYFYLTRKKKQIFEDRSSMHEEEKYITTKSLLKKVITCTIPLVVMELVGTGFQLVDLFTVVNALTTYANFTVTDASVVMNIVTTLGYKLNTIVMAIAGGVVISLLPNLTSDFVAGDFANLRKKINKTIQILIYLTIPMAVGLSFLAEPVWTIFYGKSFYGPRVFTISIFIAVFASLFMNIVVTMQSMNRYKGMYIALLSGFLFNLIMKVPFMILFHKIGLAIYHGNLFATMVGFSITIILCLFDIRKAIDIKYRSTIKQTILVLFAAGVMYLALSLISIVIPVEGYSRLMSIVITGFYAFIGMAVYFGITYKTKTFDKVVGKDLISEILNRKKHKETGD